MTNTDTSKRTLFGIGFVVVRIVAAILTLFESTAAEAYRDVYFRAYSCPFGRHPERPAEPHPLAHTCTDLGVLTPIVDERVTEIVNEKETDAQVHPLDIGYRQFSLVTADRNIVWKGVEAQGNITRIYNGSLNVTANAGGISIDTRFFPHTGSVSSGTIFLSAATSITGRVGTPSFETTSTWIVCANAPSVSIENLSPTRVTLVRGPECKMPGVSIAASVNLATEAGAPGIFTITRSGNPPVSPTTVFYQVEGTATNGVDYEALSGSLIIPVQQSFATISVTPVDDKLPEGDETVILRLQPNPAYSVESPNSATVTISDSCPIRGLDLSLIASDPGKLFEDSAKETGKVPLDSRRLPDVREELWLAYKKTDTRLGGSVLEIESGFRPEEYQKHFLDIRDTWVRFDRAIRRNPKLRDRCRPLIDVLMTELQVIHGIATAGRKYVRPGEGAAATRSKKAEGTPLVNVNSAHSGKNNVPPSNAIDIGPGSVIRDFDTLVLDAAKTYKLARPCGTDDYVHFSLKDTNCQGVVAEAHSPVNILLRDPLGRRVGYDPATSSVINEIGEDAYYSGPGSEPEIIRIGDALPGSYQLTALGTDAGHYEIVLERIDDAGESLEYKADFGVASPGSEAMLNVDVPLVLAIDIQPGDFPNVITRARREKIPVAILGTHELDVSSINEQSIMFGRTGYERTLDSCRVEDVDHDHLQDLVCQFNSKGTNLRSGGTRAVLRGTKFDGTQIIGSDSIRILRKCFFSRWFGSPSP